MAKVVGGIDGGTNIFSATLLQDFANEDVTSHSATKVTFQLTDDISVALTGTGFSGFDQNGVPTQGTITGFHELQSGSTVTNWSGMSLDFSQFWSYVPDGDSTSLQNAVFGGDDLYISRNTSTDPENADVFFSFGGNDVFDMQNRAVGAFSELTGGSGNDTFRFGATYNPANDSINGGGGGNDTLELRGDYSAGLTLGPESHFGVSSFTDITAIKLDAGFDYKITLLDYAIPEFAPLKIEGAAMGADDALTFDGSAATLTSFHIEAGAGDDVLTGGERNDRFNLLKGGADTVHGGDGSDTIAFGATAGAGDSVDGGAGNDTILISGAYDGPIAFDADALTSVERISFGAGHSYDFVVDTTQDSLHVDGRKLGAGDTLTADASSETGGQFILVGGRGDDTLIGGGGDDVLDLRFGGQDTVTGGAGNDLIRIGGALADGSSIDGGAGGDTVLFTTNFSGTLANVTLLGVERLSFTTNHDYNVTLGDADVAAGATLVVDANPMRFGTVTVDGSAETDGAFRFDVAGAQGHFIGGAGNDIFEFHQSFNGSVDGGAGSDTLAITGNASDSVDFTTANFASIERIVLEHSEGYQLTFGAGTVAAGQTLTIDGSNLTQGDLNDIDASAVAGASFVIDDPVNNSRITGSQGSDTITATGTRDNIASGGGGSDTLSGGADAFYRFGADFDSTDRVLASGGDNTLLLDGDYSAGVTLAATTIQDIQTLTLAQGFQYKLIMNDANVAAGQTLTVGESSSATDLTDGIYFDGSAETDGNFNLANTGGVDTLIGGAGNDVFDVGGKNTVAGTIDTVEGGAGNDIFNGSSIYSANAVTIDGGAGNDTLTLQTSSQDHYRSGLKFAANSLTGVETVSLTALPAFTTRTVAGISITMNDHNVAAGATMTIDGHGLIAGAPLVFDGSAETDGHFVVIGGTDNDAITGGALSDTISGGAGNNTITGGGGGDLITTSGSADILVYGGAADSTSTGFDIVTDFNVAHDKFDLPGTVAGISATVASGALDAAHFDADLAAALDASHLAASNAVIYTPNSGSFAGKTFLVVDLNGVAGYQAGHDLVVELVTPSSTTLTTADFT
jgi:Ca2+-binding RTX toxin-like protein